MHNSWVSRVAVVALLAAITTAAPTPFFPGVVFHGVPESNPGTWAWNTTKRTPPSHDDHDEHNHHQEHDKRSFGLDVNKKLEKYNKEQLEALHNALEHNHTLPAMDLTPSDLANKRPSLLAAVESFLRSHFHKRNSIGIDFGHLTHSQLQALHTAVTHNHTLPSLNLTESVLKYEKTALLAALEKFIHPTPLEKGLFGRSLGKRTPWIQSSHPFIPAVSLKPEITASAPTASVTTTSVASGFVTSTTANTRPASAIRAAIHSEIDSVLSAISAVGNAISGVETVLPTAVLKGIESEVLEFKKGLPTGVGRRFVRRDEVEKRSISLVGSPVSFPLATEVSTGGVSLVGSPVSFPLATSAPTGGR